MVRRSGRGSGRPDFIDGHGPFQAPTGLYADTIEEAEAEVNRYADLGYIQIKIYSSLNPEFVPGIVKTAHARGLRVSGHIPNGMIASQFVEDGADEMQHINFIFLNFLASQVKGHTHSRALYGSGSQCCEAGSAVEKKSMISSHYSSSITPPSM
jgi:hypothetical protein